MSTQQLRFLPVKFCTTVPLSKIEPGLQTQSKGTKREQSGNLSKAFSLQIRRTTTPLISCSLDMSNRKGGFQQRRRSYGPKQNQSSPQLLQFSGLLFDKRELFGLFFSWDASLTLCSFLFGRRRSSSVQVKLERGRAKGRRRSRSRIRAERSRRRSQAGGSGR